MSTLSLASKTVTVRMDETTVGFVVRADESYILREVLSDGAACFPEFVLGYMCDGGLFRRFFGVLMAAFF